MKTRVIKYDRSGTKVVNAFFELEPVDENVFKAFCKAVEYGGPSQDIFRGCFITIVNLQEACSRALPFLQ